MTPPGSSRRALPREIGVAMAFAAVFTYFGFHAPGFASGPNLLTVARQYAEMLLVSVGMTLVILIGGIDLSVGSVAGLSGMIAGVLCRSDGWIAACIAALAAGIAVGSLNGILIGVVRLSPVIVTLATWAGARSLAYALTHGHPIGSLPDAFVALGDTWVGGYVPSTALGAGAVAILASIVLRATRFGRSLVAEGRNERAAYFSGIPTSRNGFIVYAVAGLLSAAAGILMTARAATAVPDAGVGFEFEAITAVVLGGARIDGGYASIVGTTLGVATLGLLHNGCNLLGYDSTWQTLAVGLLLLAAVVFDARARSAMASYRFP